MGVLDAKLHWDSTTLQVTFEDWDLRKILKAVLPSDLDFSSYSQAGHIVHVNLRDNLLPYKTIIGQILLEKVGKCRTVVNKIDGITSEYRNFELDLLAGEDNYVTETIEGGIRYQLDFSKKQSNYIKPQSFNSITEAIRDCIPGLLEFSSKPRT
ncbi:unnamed protein product [Nippostrongylus brasiliensis]|uniref:tRNA wybutosine-synthesizing protein 2 homolog n=1 Tax=Nippostrongylus brasiliensis TaxID=27835 RepID=A0A0N4XR09_NIPBR|nr:unnamed protein product [Nippostrongylus brasiliensis]